MKPQAPSDTAPPDPGDVRERIRRLVLSGDNVRKVRHDRTGAERAHERFLEARRLAAGAGLDDLVRIIDVRLGDAGAGDGTR